MSQPENQIAEVRLLDIGGVQQGLAIVGNPANPALLMLHGGGLPLPGVASKYRYRSLAEHFLLVFWDQRGTGLSNSKQLTREQMRLESFVDDIGEITRFIKSTYHKDRIVLLGHSWGSMIGLAAIKDNPEDYSAYIGVAQQVNVLASDQAIYSELLADPATNQRARLQEIGPPPYTDVADWLTLREIVARNGGLVSGEGEIGMFGMLGRMLGSFAFNPDYSMLEPFRIQSKMYAALANLYDDMVLFDKLSVEQLAIPVILLHGEHDLNSHPGVVKLWYEKLDAPLKRFVKFEKSAHMLMWEEPKKFEQEVIGALLDTAS